MSGASDQQGTTGDVRTNAQQTPGVARRRLRLFRRPDIGLKRSAEADNAIDATRLYDRRTAGDAPGAADRQPADSTTQASDATPSRRTAGDAPGAAADRQPADSTTQASDATPSRRTAGEAPDAADRQPADSTMSYFVEIVSSRQKTINTCIIAVVFFVGAAIFFVGATYFAEHVHAGLVVNIAKGGLVVSVTAAGTVTIAITAGLARGLVDSFRKGRKKKARDNNTGEGPTIEYRG